MRQHDSQVEANLATWVMPIEWYFVSTKAVTLEQSPGCWDLTAGDRMAEMSCPMGTALKSRLEKATAAVDMAVRGLDVESIGLGPNQTQSPLGTVHNAWTEAARSWADHIAHCGTCRRVR
jgi:hypothetical protein